MTIFFGIEAVAITVFVIQTEIFNRLARESFNAIQECSKPVIAAVNGPALGAGLGLVAHCDIILCSDNAVLGMPEIDVGLAGGAAMLQTLFGKSRARRMFYTGWRVPAEELYRTGVVECCVPLDHLMPEAMKIAADIASKTQALIQASMKIGEAIYGQGGPGGGEGGAPGGDGGGAGGDGVVDAEFEEVDGKNKKSA